MNPVVALDVANGESQIQDYKRLIQSYNFECFCKTAQMGKLHQSLDGGRNEKSGQSQH